MAIDPNNLSGTARQTFAEEFNNLSLWNGTSGTWGTNYNFNGQNISTLTGNGELQWYVEANDPSLAAIDPWKVNNGILTITAASADESIKPYIHNYNYTSGMLTSQYSFSQLYGYFEISAKLPAGQGLWPAFWMLPTNGAWRPEIDIVEYLGSDTHSLWQFSHPADQSYDRYFNTVTGADLSTGFHRYGVDWEADKITFYLDGQVTGVAPTAPEMNQAMYMILNLAVGGSWAGPPGAGSIPANLQVDYIRAYQSLTTPTFTNLVISPASQSAAEGTGSGNTLTYTINRTGDLTGTSSVAWAVTGSGGSPVSGADFAGGTLPSGTVTFAAGQNAATVTLTFSGDTSVEPDEGFAINLSNPVGASITGGSASGSILNDDGSATASLSISPATVSQPEGQSGTTWFIYNVTRSGSVAGPSSANFVVTGTGANPASSSDFVSGSALSGTLYFGGGETTKNIWVQVAGDTTVESNETFTVTLTSASGASIVDGVAQGVIVNDDGGAPPQQQPALTISPGSVSHSEGASGTTAYSFTVTRSGDLANASSAAWSVAGSGANAANAADFAGGQLPSGTVSFAAGASSATITVNVAGDATVEADESFAVTLSNPSGATISTASAQGVIVNDDSGSPPPGGSGVGTAGNDVFNLSPGSNLSVTGYDAAGQDALGVPTGAGGFSLAGYSGQSSLTIVDAAAWWSNISGAQVVRWSGDAAAVDSAAKVDGLLQAMPGNGGGGVLFLADGPGNVVSVYYDAAPSQAGGTSLVATLNGVASPASLNASDFKPGGSAPPPGGGGGGTGGTAGNDTFNLVRGSTLAISGYDQVGQDTLGVPTGAGGFQLAGYSGQAQVTMVDAAAWWSNIGGAQVVRWVGDLTAVDTVSEVDALLEAMPGNLGGGRLFIGGAAGGGLGVYYDPNPQARGDASLVATISNLNDPHSLVVADFQLF